MIGLQTESRVNWSSNKKCCSGAPWFLFYFLFEEVKTMACGKKCGTKATAKKKTAKKK
jgi:hypothetical protein